MSVARFGLRTRSGQVSGLIQRDSFISFDPDAQAFINASGITDPTQQNAINQLVINLKTYNIWTKMKAIYPFVGGTATTHKFNLKDPRDLDVAFRLAFNGGWTHSSTGALPNGTNAFGNTFINALSGITQTSVHLTVYLRTNATGGIDVGTFDGSGILLHIQAAINSCSGNTATVVNFTTTTDRRGFWAMSKRAHNDRENYRNGISEGTNSFNEPTAFPNLNLYIGARSRPSTADLFSPREQAFTSIGDGLTDTEQANLYTTVQAYQTSLSRNI